MNVSRLTYSVLLFLGIACSVVSPCVFGESQAAKNKRDEKNEDERVRQAKKALDQKVSDFNRTAKAFREATSNLGSLQRSLELRQKEIPPGARTSRRILEEKTGIPASLKKIHSVSSEITEESEKIESK